MARMGLVLAFVVFICAILAYPLVLFLRTLALEGVGTHALLWLSYHGYMSAPCKKLGLALGTSPCVT